MCCVCVSVPGSAASGDAAAPAAAAGASSDPDEVASNWAQGADPKSGKSYYYNRVTKKTSWAKPACMASAAAPASAGPPPTPAAAAPAPAQPAAPTSNDWAEAKDPNSGKSYWYNRLTKETTWKNPHAAAAAAAPAAPPAAPAAPAASSPPPPLPEATPAASSPVASPVVSASAPPAGRMALMRLRDEEDEAPAAAAGTEAEAAPQNIEDLVRDDDSEDEGGASDRKKLEEDDTEGHEYRFAKHRNGFVNRLFRTGKVFDESKLLTFKKSLIKKALLKQNRELDEEAVQTFKNIMSYMGDRSSSKPPIEHAKKMLRNLMIAPSGLRDEAYMQICKQTNGNPKTESTIKGWELLSFFLATFPPSKNLKSFLLDHCNKAINDINTNPRVLSLAKLAVENLPTIIQLGQRKQVPSTVELQSLMESKPVPIKVSLCDASFKTLSIDPYILISEVEKMMHEKFAISYRTPFALYEQADANEERLLDPSERMLDVIAGWENKPLVEEIKVEKKAERAKIYEKAPTDVKKVVAKVIKFDKVLYKAKLVLKSTNPDLIADPEAVNLIYVQATADVVTERYPCNEKDITVLAALQLQASFGDYKKDEHVPGWLKPKIVEFMPTRLLEKKPGKQSDSLVAEWEQKILSKYMKVSGFTALEAKLNYLDYVQEWVFYGSTFFTVEQRQFKDYPSPLTLGINCEGCLLMHPEKKTVLENYAFTDIVTWGHSDEKFIVVVGNIVQQRKLIFKTTDGKVMNHLIHDYVKLKVKNKDVGGPSSAAAPSLF